MNPTAQLNMSFGMGLWHTRNRPASHFDLNFPTEIPTKKKGKLTWFELNLITLPLVENGGWWWLARFSSVALLQNAKNCMNVSFWMEIRSKLDHANHHGNDWPRFFLLHLASVLWPLTSCLWLIWSAQWIKWPNLIGTTDTHLLLLNDWKYRVGRLWPSHLIRKRRMSMCDGRAKTLLIFASVQTSSSSSACWSVVRKSLCSRWRWTALPNESIANDVDDNRPSRFPLGRTSYAVFDIDRLTSERPLLWMALRWDAAGYSFSCAIRS